MLQMAQDPGSRNGVPKVDCHEREGRFGLSVGAIKVRIAGDGDLPALSRDSSGLLFVGRPGATRSTKGGQRT
jgi:hypothetical protein